MTIHMFAFRWKAGTAAEYKTRAVEEIGGLQGKVPGLLETWVGVNVSPRGRGYELGGVMKFADATALEAYADHPAHRKLLDWLLPFVEPVEVDFDA